MYSNSLSVNESGNSSVFSARVLTVCTMIAADAMTFDKARRWALLILVDIITPIDIIRALHEDL